MRAHVADAAACALEVAEAHDGRLPENCSNDQGKVGRQGVKALPCPPPHTHTHAHNHLFPGWTFAGLVFIWGGWRGCGATAVFSLRTTCPGCGPPAIASPLQARVPGRGRGARRWRPQLRRRCSGDHAVAGSWVGPKPLPGPAAAKSRAPCTAQTAPATSESHPASRDGHPTRACADWAEDAGRRRAPDWLAAPAAATTAVVRVVAVVVVGTRATAGGVDGSGRGRRRASSSSHQQRIDVGSDHRVSKGEIVLGPQQVVDIVIGDERRRD